MENKHVFEDIFWINHLTSVDFKQLFLVLQICQIFSIIIFSEKCFVLEAMRWAIDCVFERADCNIVFHFYFILNIDSQLLHTLVHFILVEHRVRVNKNTIIFAVVQNFICIHIQLFFGIRRLIVFTQTPDLV